MPVPDCREDLFPSSPTAFIAGDGGALAGEFAAVLRAAGWTVSHDKVADRADLVAWFGPADGAAAATALTDALLLARTAKPALERAAAAGGRAAFLAITRLDGSFGLSGIAGDAAALGGVGGLVKTLAMEAPGLFCRQIDLAAGLSGESGAKLLIAELHDARNELRQSGYPAPGRRQTIGFGDTPDVSLGGPGHVTAPAADDLFVITGGARGVTAACAVAFAARFHCQLLLLGRTEPAEEPDWALGVPADALMATIARQRKADGLSVSPRTVQAVRADLLAGREIRETLSAAGAHSTSVRYLAVDVTDATAMAAALAPYRDRITGVVHGAGVLADQAVEALSADAIARVFAPKLGGWQALLAAVDPARLRHAVLFGSVAGVFGNLGQATYAVANEALNRLGCALHRRNPATAVTTINWGAWAGGMVGPELERLFRERGVPLIPLAEGAHLFAEQFTEPRSRDLVCVIAPAAPLSGPPAPANQEFPVRVRRAIDAIATTSAMADHAIGDRAVLPATAALGAILNVVTRTGYLEPRTVHGFTVHKGVVFDDTVKALSFTMTEPGTDGRVPVLVTDEAGRPRYRATVAAHGAVAAQIPDLPALDGGQDLADRYADGTLFHGPSLRGVRALLTDGPRMVLRAQLPAANFAVGAYGSDRYHPLQADVLLQAVELYIRHHIGQPCLPSAIGAAELYAALPDDQPFYVVVTDLGGSSPQHRCTVGAYNTDGHPLLRFLDVDVVCAPALAEKFAESARRHAHV